jgi:hypothetical protein
VDRLQAIRLLVSIKIENQSFMRIYDYGHLRDKDYSFFGFSQGLHSLSIPVLRVFLSAYSLLVYHLKFCHGLTLMNTGK